MTRKRSVLCSLLAVLVIASMALVSCGIDEAAPKDEITLNFVGGDFTMAIGDTLQLSWNTNSKEQVTFAVDNDGVSVSSDGLVTALKNKTSVVTAAVEGRQASKKIIVRDPSVGIITGNDIEYTFEISADGLYEMNLFTEQTQLSIKDIADNIEFRFDDSYTTRLKSKSLSDGKIMLGTKYLKVGRHKMLLSNAGALLTESKIGATSALVYDKSRLSLSKKWMDELYVETGVNIDKPNFLGYYEAKGWDDIWTHCQYLPYTMYIANEEGSADYLQRAKKIADDFLIAKMLTESGGVYTVYQSNEDVYQVSIEQDMPTNKFELWRGNSAFAEEMLNCYHFFKNETYLDYAKKAMDYVLSSWTKTMVEGGISSYYTRYTSSKDGAIETMSTGRAVMVFSQLFQVTNDARYKSAAEMQAKALLKAQETKYAEIEGLFSPYVYKSGDLDEFRHGNAYANALLGLSWVYKITGKQLYLDAIDKAVQVLKTVYDDELGMIIVSNGELFPTNPSTGPAYMAGRIGQAVMTAAYFTDDIEYYREGERVLEFAFGRNKNNRDLQNPENGWFYYTIDYTGMSNIETSGEIYLAQIQYYYLQEIWGI